jgi:flagellar hook assembly protein FlgD
MSGAGIGPERPGAFGLRPNFPNPFNPETSVVYTTDAGGDVSLAVYDVQGREVRRLADGYLEAGTYTVVWDGRDAKGVEVPSGSYFCRFRAGSRNAVIKMLKSK